MKERPSTLSRDASGGLRSVGRRLLGGILQRVTLAKVVTRTKNAFQKSALSDWANGVRIPERFADRAALERIWGIDMHTWDWPDLISATTEGQQVIVPIVTPPTASRSRFSVTLPRSLAARVEALRNGASMSTTLAALVAVGLDQVERDSERTPHTAA